MKSNNSTDVKPKHKRSKKIIRVLGIIPAVITVCMLVGTILHATYFENKKEEIKPYGQMVDVYDGQMHVYKMGSGQETIILLPGMGIGLPSADFGPLMRRLSEKYTVVSIEYFGVGFSSQTQRARTSENYVDEIRTALKSAGVEAPYILMPHSISSVYSEYYASKYPDEVQAIISLDGTSTAYIGDDMPGFVRSLLGVAKFQQAIGFTSIMAPIATNKDNLLSIGYTEKEISDLIYYAGFSVNDNQLSRLGIELSRQTLANWMIQGSERWLRPLYERMHQHLLNQDILHADETTLQVLREPGRPAQSTSYMWLYRSGRDGPAIILYDYQTTRASKHPRQFLSGFKGYLHVDGYAGYNGLPDINLVGCWAHARRKFDESLKALPAGQRNAPVAAKEGLEFCNQLFAIEREIHEATPEERYKIRLERSRPIMDAFSVWLKYQGPRVLPKSAFGQAINYCRNQWDKLEAFLKDGRLELDNNRSERSIKPFVIGRKNFLFSNTPKGAKASATIYSIVESAKENGLNPYSYLQYLFEKLPNVDIQDQDAVDELLPWSSALPPECYLKK
jgi:pimeloyl-ACP methyl ester carboxylesterase